MSDYEDYEEEFYEDYSENEEEYFDQEDFDEREFNENSGFDESDESDGGDAHEQKLTATFKDTERSGGNIICGTSRQDLKYSSPVDRFKIEINFLAREFIEENMFNLSEESIITLCEKVDKINYPQYVNPLGYVIGYIATAGGFFGISDPKYRESYNKIIRSLNNNQITNMAGISIKLLPVDIIRYSRFWENLRIL